MRSASEYLEVLEDAAQRLLQTLTAEQGMVAAALWCRLNAAWIRLVECGDGEHLPGEVGQDVGPLADGVFAQPLRLGEEVAGWLVWQGGGRQELAPGMLAPLQSLLLATRLRDELVVARFTQDTLLEVCEVAAESATLENFVPQLRRLLQRLLPSRAFFVTLCEDSSVVPSFPFLLREAEEGVPGDEMLLAIADRVVALEQGLALGADELAILCGAAARHERMPHCCLAEPLAGSTGKLIGVLGMLSFDDAHVYDADHLARFGVIARHLALTLDKLLQRTWLERQVWLRSNEFDGVRARLYAEQAARKRGESMQSALFRIAELSNAALSLDAFLGGVHRLLAEFIDARNCYVALYDAQRDLIHFPYCADQYLGEPRPRSPGRGVIELVLHSGRPLLIDDGGVSRRLSDVLSVDGHRAESWLGVPLYSGTELKGVLAVLSYTTAGLYTQHDQELLEFVAHHVGATLTRLQALEDLQDAYVELEERVRARTSELDAANAQLKHDSLHDLLTKLPNRTFFNRALSRAWDAYQQSEEHRFAVVFIDLDRFKLVNDTLGHHSGDHLLFEAGARIRSCLRPSDFLARLGGDEFAVLLTGIQHAEECERIGRRIVVEFDRPIILSGREVFTTASVGLVLADREHYRKADDLLRDADHAMYRTKQQGRHGYTLFSHEHRLNQADHLALEAELRHALDVDNELVPYYQPFIDAHSGRLAGFEALVRWQHPARGLVSPGLFMSVAEESGLLTRLDRYMVRHACRQLALWRDEGRVGDHIAMHINLSSCHFHEPGLVSWLLELIAEHRLPPHCLHLEITESALIDVPEVAADAMHSLHLHGLKLALDDFGTGYSALSYLHRYRFDVLKIDQAFVREVDSKEESAAIVRAILALAQALGLDVVAEGVETVAQFETLRTMGCPKMQGFLFAMPAPAERLDWEALERVGREVV